MVHIAPRQLRGVWRAGYALDLHTISSDFLGYDEYGHPCFDTKRSEMGELLYRLKYQSDKIVVRVIAEAVAGFIQGQGWEADLIIPVPPSRSRVFQPVMVIAEAIASELGVPYCGDCIVKVRETPELKDIYEFSQRQKLLKGAYVVSKKALSGKRVIVFDDLYRSGATLHEVSEVVLSDGQAATLYVLTLTMTRVRQ